MSSDGATLGAGAAVSPLEGAPLSLGGPHRQNSMQRAGAAFDAIFGLRNRRRRQSLFPSTSSFSRSVQDLPISAPSALRKMPDVPHVAYASRSQHSLPLPALPPPPDRPVPPVPLMPPIYNLGPQPLAALPPPRRYEAAEAGPAAVRHVRQKSSLSRSPLTSLETSLAQVLPRADADGLRAPPAEGRPMTEQAWLAQHMQKAPSPKHAHHVRDSSFELENAAKPLLRPRTPLPYNFPDAPRYGLFPKPVSPASPSRQATSTAPKRGATPSPTQKPRAQKSSEPVVPAQAMALNQQRYAGRYLHQAFEHINPAEFSVESNMSVLQIALIYCLENEGSSFVNDPQDHGGPTRYGITIQTLSHFLGRQASLDEVKNISTQTVSEIYRRYYWAPIRGDEICAQNVATAYLDMAILCGVTAATRLVQGAVGTLADGVMGPKTLIAINTANPEQLLTALSIKACGYFSAIAVRDSTQAKFLPGWQLRAHKMLNQKKAAA